MGLRNARERNPESRSMGAGFLVALGCGFALLVAFRVAYEAYERHTPFIVDDAYITLRYARHLAEGLGPVWNPGERVEGYTSFFTVVLLAMLRVVGVGLESAALYVNAAGLALLALVVSWHGARLVRGVARAPIALAPALVVASYPPLYVWIHGRLEAPLFAGFIGLALHATTRLLEAPTSRKWQLISALTLGLLPLIRPDGGVFGLVGAAFVLIACVRCRSARFADYGRFAAAALLLPLAHIAFRRIYYGEWVPNTVIAKTTGLPRHLLIDSGLDYLEHFARARPYFLQLAIAALPVALVARSRRIPALYIATSAAAYISLIVVAGGDHMIAHRLLLPVVPPLAMLWAEGLAGLASLRSHPAGAAPAAAVACSAALLFGLTPGERYEPAERPDPAAYVGTIVGEYLRDSYPKGTLIALHNAGSTPYFAPHLRFIDMLGLNDTHIARRKIQRLELPAQRWPGHAKGDGAYVLSRKPDVILLGPAEGTLPQRPWFLSDLELARSKTFAEEYELRVHRIDVSARPHHRAIAATRRGYLIVRSYERAHGP